MSGLFSSPYSYDPSFIEAMITNVDPIRFTCSVRTFKGQFLNEVPWLLPTGGSGSSGVHYTPNIGDQVVVMTSLSYPVIIGSLPRLGLPTTQLTNVTGSTTGVDVGGSPNMLNGVTANPNKPADMLPGEFVVTSKGGGIMALLNNGTNVIKSSALAQIITSKIDDLIRVVARNFERISDIGQQTVANVKGRLYEFVGWDRDFTKSKNSIYELKDIIGDVAAGEVLRADPNSGATIPAADSRVRKYSLENNVGSPLMVETLTDDGKLVVVVSNGGVTTTTHDNSLFDINVVNGTYSKITVVPESVTIDYNGKTVGIFNDSGFSVTCNNNKMEVNETNCIYKFGTAGNSPTITLDNNGVNITYLGHYFRLDSSGPHSG